MVSVDHPDVVENYRFAHGIHERAQAKKASTEELREALLRYRSLFDELLRADDGEAGETAVRGSGGVDDRAGADGSDPDRDLGARDTAGSPEPASPTRDEEPEERP
jgi:hypothetical protein